MSTTRFLIYSPQYDSYVKMDLGGWTSGHSADAVNSYGSLEEIRAAMAPFESLKDCKIVEIVKTVEIVKQWELV